MTISLFRLMADGPEWPRGRLMALPLVPHALIPADHLLSGDPEKFSPVSRQGPGRCGSAAG